MKKIYGFIVLIFILSNAISAQQNITNSHANGNVTLIPRNILFSSEDKFSVMLSPDGSKISYIAPVNGVTNIWVGPVGDPGSAKPVTNDTYRGITRYNWAYTNEHILYLQDKNGDWNWQVYSVNLSNEKIKNFTHLNGVQTTIQALSFKYPEEIIIGLNNRSPEFRDLYRLNIETGGMTLLLKNDGFHKFYIDDDYHIRFASRQTPGGGKEIFERTEKGDWKPFAEIGWEDELTVDILGFDSTGKVIYLKDSRSRDTAALYAYNLETGEKTIIAEDGKVDLDGRGFYRPLIHPTKKNVQAVAAEYDRMHWKIIDPSIKDDIEYLRTVNDGDFFIESRTLDDKAWTVVYMSDDGPLAYYYYDRDARNARFLFTLNEKLESEPLAKMIPVIIKSRDGLDLVSYYTLPSKSDSNGDDIPDRPLPMVLLVHGGPEGRDYWGLNSIHQLLANRGYAVLSINFRGSTGFGKNFTNAGKFEYGRKMQYDLIDGVDWAVKKGIADPDRVGIMGGSYGGYATLAALAFTPEIFACGVDICGMSNLTSSEENIPPYDHWDRVRWTNFVGNISTKEGRELLSERSPLNYANRVRRPLLIAQGANDPIVNQSESAQMVLAMQERNLSVTYVLFPDEGHGFVRPKNNIAFYAVAEAFFAKHLGGRFEPIDKDFQGSAITVPVGAEEVPGLEAALNGSDYHNLPEKSGK